ncbi:hypothetical protein VSH64_29025 [Amycolatopsis rhabdoformis]|uniref:Uncharacterized protein n=1 Tax=Amycolatopsis rhabdoformis TaxID=1448059 RepID=A0ABZ1HXP5_9PSEU|nr:hypothetical protein [Amycolatopsis rhabdoformis]WSE26911.1 hypothetical protein VSH64_29025 [Amycolatopsis rhabdoformis]
MLALAVVAVVVARSFTAIGEWAADAPQHVPAPLDPGGTGVSTQTKRLCAG